MLKFFFFLLWKQWMNEIFFEFEYFFFVGNKFVESLKVFRSFVSYYTVLFITWFWLYCRISGRNWNDVLFTSSYYIRHVIYCFELNLIFLNNYLKRIWIYYHWFLMTEDSEITDPNVNSWVKLKSFFIEINKN